MEQLPYSTLVPGEVADSGNAKYWIITCCTSVPYGGQAEPVLLVTDVEMFILGIPSDIVPVEEVNSQFAAFILSHRMYVLVAWV